MSDAREIREKMKTYRESLSDEELLNFSQAIETKVYEMIHSMPNRKDILCFYPLEVEVNLLPMYEKLLKERYNLYFPKTYPDEILFYQVDNMRDFKLGAFRIMEPYGTKDRNLYKDERAVCIVPGLAFSESLHRIGYGGGYYDRFLRDKNIKRIGVCFQDQILDFEPQGHDVDMHMVITDQNIYQ